MTSQNIMIGGYIYIYILYPHPNPRKKDEKKIYKTIKHPLNTFFKIPFDPKPAQVTILARSIRRGRNALSQKNQAARLQYTAQYKDDATL